jgi:hypothetical protein
LSSRDKWWLVKDKQPVCKKGFPFSTHGGTIETKGFWQNEGEEEKCGNNLKLRATQVQVYLTRLEWLQEAGAVVFHDACCILDPLSPVCKIDGDLVVGILGYVAWRLWI